MLVYFSVMIGEITVCSLELNPLLLEHVMCIVCVRPFSCSV